jgi:predicted MFS family arabinose efflux permease
MEQEKTKERLFTRYQLFVIAILSLLQFTVILDFMVLSPLGVLLLDELHITASQFGIVVAAYAFSAGASGILTAGFADKFDRKKLLVFFYTGFIAGTLLCALAPNYLFLLFARIVTGLFGGVVGSITVAIITDLFRMEVRGRVMGFVQMSFALAQIFGMPIGWELAIRYGWHTPFWLIVAGGSLLGVIIYWKLRPVDQHLGTKTEQNAFRHLLKTVSRPDYTKAFLATTLLATGGFMLMPFGSTFGIHNLGLLKTDLRWLYIITGVVAFFAGPLIGVLSDKLGKYPIFFAGTVLAGTMVGIYCHLGITPLWQVILLNSVLFVGITSRMVSSSALLTAIPETKDRGAFMSINASTQQIAGGVASIIAGLIVVQTPSGYLEHYDTLGWVVISTMLVALLMMYFLNRRVQRKFHTTENL